MQGRRQQQNGSSDTSVNDYRWVTAAALSSRLSRSTDIGIIFLTVCCSFAFAASIPWITLSSAFLVSVSQEKYKDWTIVWHCLKSGWAAAKLSISLHLLASLVHQFFSFSASLCVFSPCLPSSPSSWMSSGPQKPPRRSTDLRCYGVEPGNSQHFSFHLLLFQLLTGFRWKKVYSEN